MIGADQRHSDSGSVSFHTDRRLFMLPQKPYVLRKHHRLASFI
ncbi:hypothetical protein [Nitrobacter sp. JJSN]|jgi:hypothetical protein